ncbi:MAG TPA: ABC transporter permease, partial [Candidatus Acidoferrum sp.]|nr:ABC transporter permease [Candidatus Acidoferrum sp.]
MTSAVRLGETMNLFSFKRFEGMLAGLGQISVLTRDAVVSLCKWRITWREFVYQLYFIGVKSQAVVLVTGAFTGMVLGAQSYFQFHKVKMD